MTSDALFIADLHLQVGEPDTIELARQFVQQTATHMPYLYILGDLVEYWIGDDADEGGLNAFFDDLARLSRAGTGIAVMHGNRDFLLGPDFAARIGAKLITADSYLLETAAAPLLLMHGDTLCTDDLEYQAMRAQLRSKQWQQAFLAKPVIERRTFADSLRQQSQISGKNKEHALMDVNAGAVSDVMQRFNVQTLVHGHTHKPASHPVKLEDNLLKGKQATRHVLGDWHADHAIYGVLENGHFRLETINR